jgi:hypothetical protein
VVMGFLGNAFVFSSICSVAKNAERLFKKKKHTPVLNIVKDVARCWLCGTDTDGWLGRVCRVRSAPLRQGSCSQRLNRNEMQTMLHRHTQTMVSPTPNHNVDL